MPTAPTKTAPPQKRRFTVGEYYKMAEADVFSPEDHVELLDGHIYLMPPIGSQHAACVRRLDRLFQDRVGSHALVSVQNPIRLSQTSEPEPDLALLTPREDEYAARHPRPDDVFMVVEVADTSLTFDQQTKLPLYARAGIPEVWIVALDDDRMHVYREPKGDRFGVHETHGPNDDVTVAAVSSPDPVSVETILGA